MYYSTAQRYTTCSVCLFGGIKLISLYSCDILPRSRRTLLGELTQLKDDSTYIYKYYLGYPMRSTRINLSAFAHSRIRKAVVVPRDLQLHGNVVVSCFQTSQHAQTCRRTVQQRYLTKYWLRRKSRIRFVIRRHSALVGCSRTNGHADVVSYPV